MSDTHPEDLALLRTLAHLHGAMRAQAGRQCPAPAPVVGSWVTILAGVLRSVPPEELQRAGIDPEDLPAPLPRRPA